MPNYDIAVLISIQPIWCDRILRGTKTVEIRKHRPMIPTPFRCFIYCTEPNTKDVNKILELHISGEHKIQKLNGKVIGYFDCDSADFYPRERNAFAQLADKGYISGQDLYQYCGANKGLYGLHITNLTVFGRPRELSEFTTKEGKQVMRAPQSWYYIQMPEDRGDGIAV